jgi:hypothetical protein
VAIQAKSGVDTSVGLYECVLGHSQNTRVVSGHDEISKEKGRDQSFIGQEALRVAQWFASSPPRSALEGKLVELHAKRG